MEIYNFFIENFIHFGYIGIIIMMTLESSFIPFPSEVVMITAGYQVALGTFNIYLVIGGGILGSLIGGYINYIIGNKLGRDFLLKYGKYLLLPPKKYHKVEEMFNKNNGRITLIGRLIPGVRQYISFPAGVFKMPLINFLSLTGIGAGVWVTFLTFVGYYFGGNKRATELLIKNFKVGIIGILLVIFVTYLIINKRKRKELEGKERRVEI